MSSQHSKQHSNSANNSAENNKKNRHIKLPRIPFLATVFILFWGFCSIIYGEVFYICEQFTYFAFDSALMEDVTCVKNGSLQVLGRFFLLFFKYPWLGGLVFSFILTAITYFLIHIFNFRKYWRLLTVLPGFIWTCCIVFVGLNVFYQYDQATFFYLPVIFLLFLLIISIIIRVFFKRRYCGIFSDIKTDDICPNYVNNIVIVISFSLLTFWCNTYRRDALDSSKMMHLCQNQEWHEMIETALNAPSVSRTVAAYYAIALSMTDQLNERLFDIFFQYPKCDLINRTGEPDWGISLYEAEIDFHCGLINTAYHNSMEHVVMAGKSIFKLKYMFLVSLLNQETELADKYLEIIGKMPFEQDFVDKYKPMMYNEDLVNNDYYLTTISNLRPIQDAYEEQFPSPTFIGYHQMLNRGHTRKVLSNCIATNLYTKDMDGFMRLAQMISDEPNVPASFEDAIVVQAMRTKDYSFLQQIPEYAVSTTKQMLNEASMMKGKSTKEKGAALKNKYTGKYSFYYFYQNVSDNDYTNIDNPLNKVSRSSNGSGVN